MQANLQSTAIGVAFMYAGAGEKEQAEQHCMYRACEVRTVNLCLGFREGVVIEQAGLAHFPQG